MARGSDSFSGLHAHNGRAAACALFLTTRTTDALRPVRFVGILVPVSGVVDEDEPRLGVALQRNRYGGASREPGTVGKKQRLVVDPVTADPKAERSGENGGFSRVSPAWEPTGLIIRIRLLRWRRAGNRARRAAMVLLPTCRAVNRMSRRASLRRIAACLGSAMKPKALCAQAPASSSGRSNSCGASASEGEYRWRG